MFCLPVTVAKFIIKSSLLLLSLNKVRSAGTVAETCTVADCYHVCPACTKPIVGSQPLSESVKEVKYLAMKELFKGLSIKDAIYMQNISLFKLKGK